MHSQLTGSHRATFDAVFQHPIARNLAWRDVHAMLSALPGATLQENEGTFKVTRGGKTVVLHRPVRKNVVDVQELMDLRRFLEQTEPASAPPQAALQGAHLLIVIDHRQARIYRTELHGAVPQRIVPYDPHGAGRHLHYVEEDTSGQRKPEQKSFYEAIAKAIQGAEQILLFGTGTGSSSAMEQLQSDLKHRHADLAKHIVGAIAIDEQHLTDDQILAKARDYYTGIASK